jgi:tRNA nucleotidyltransferase (CCA-adding enzyme)
MLAVRVADRLGSGAKETSWRLEEMKARIEGQLQQPFSMNDMAIDGDVLMKELGMKPGPELGKMLHALFEKVLEKPELNTREQLLKLVKEMK